MSALTHVTFRAVQAMSGAPMCFDASWIRACDWARARAGEALGVGAVEDGARPTCPECAVHLDAALKMAGQ